MHHCSEARLAFALPRIYREFAPYSEKFCNRLEEVAPLSDAEVWKESFRDFYRAMRLCTNWGTGMLLTLFNRLADRRFQGEQALLSFGRQRVPQWLGDIHEFRNPANGVTCNLGLRELRQQARATILGLAVEVEEFISSSETQRPQTRFATRIGPSLNTGLIGSKKADMRFFDVKELS